MALTGIQKAALLLTALDQTTATELLKGQSQEIVQKVAMELSRWDGKSKKDPEKLSLVAYEFCSDLTKKKDDGLHIKNFIGSLMQGAAIAASPASKDKTDTLQNTMQQVAIENDPYAFISDAAAAHLAVAIKNEPPQAIAIVLSAVAPKLSTEVLAQLPEEKAELTIWRMAQGKEVSAKTVRRIGEIICKRLLEMQTGENAPAQEGATTETLRQVALVLNGLKREKRDAYLRHIQKRNEDTASTIRGLMVTWDDISRIEDKSLQQLLRNIEASVLAKAMHEADGDIASKINANISERMTDMIEEEVSLMGDIRKKDVLAAREEVVKPLREALQAEELTFIEEEDAE